MIRNLFVCSALVVVCIAGCSSPTFTNLGNGVGVPTESIDNYAETNGISWSEAKTQMLAELNEKQQADAGD